MSEHNVGDHFSDAPSFEYDAFISYRRGDGAWHARSLRQRLQNVRIPPEITSARADRKLSIYLDQVYERATDDFFENTIKPALAASRHLVVVKTASAMNALPDGSANWLVQEVEYFRDLPSEARSISVAIASGDLTGALPGRLDETHPNVERLDLRRWRWYRTPAVDDRVLSLAAALHEIRPADMPALRQEDSRRIAAQKRTRRLLAGVAIALLLAASSVALWQYLRVREESYRRNIAVAASLWNRLVFSDSKRIASDELNALWEIRRANAKLRDAFIIDLISGGDRGSRLGRRPLAVMRAIYLRWPEEQAARVFDALVRKAPTSEPSEGDLLWQACESFARVLPARRVGAAVASVLAATKGKTERLALPTLRTLAGKLTPAEAQSVLVPILKQIKTTPDPAALKEYWVVVWAFGGAVTPDQAASIRMVAVRAFERTIEPDDLEMLSRAVGALPGALTADEARRVLSPIAKQIATTTWALQTLGDAIAALGPKLPAEAAQHALDLVLPKLGADPFAASGLAPAIGSLASRLSPASARSALDRVLRATDRLEMDFAAEPLIGAIAAISERLTAAEAAAMLPSVMATLSRTMATLSRTPVQEQSTSLNRANAIDRAVNTIAARLKPSQGKKALTNFFESIGVSARGLAPLPFQASPPQDASSVYARRELMPALLVLARKLSPEDTDAALGKLLNLLDVATSTGRLNSVAAMVAVLAPKATVHQRSALIGPVCRRLQVANDLGVLLPLKSIASALGGSCTLPPEATPTLERLLAKLNTQDVFTAYSDAQAFQQMAEMVTRDQARTLLTPTLAVLEHQEGGPVMWFLAETLRSWFDRGMLTEADAARVRTMAMPRMAAMRNVNGLQTLTMVIATLPGRLTTDEGHAALTSLLNADRESASTGDFFGSRRQIAEAILLLAPRLTSEQQQTAANAMRSELAWAETDELALSAANAVIALSPREPEARAQAIVEILKYPAAAGAPATDALLAALRAAARATVTDTRADLTFVWIHASFPHTNLGAPPACPSPRHAGLACPATANPS